MKDLTMTVIDFTRKGNVVRFYLGKKEKEFGWTDPDYADPDTNETPDWLTPSETYYGDDWNDRHYEHNAGRVYDQYIKDHYDLFVSYDGLVLEPCEGTYNSNYSKDDMVERKIPCIIIVPAEVYKNDLRPWNLKTFEEAIKRDDVIKIYFGDTVKDLLKIQDKVLITDSWKEIY